MQKHLRLLLTQVGWQENKPFVDCATQSRTVEMDSMFATQQRIDFG